MSGPCFAAQLFKDWCQRSGIILEFSSPYLPQSNGAAERNLSLIKRLLTKTANEGSDILAALSLFWDTPCDGSKISPFAIMFNREKRDPMLPALSRNPNIPDEAMANLERKSNRKERRNAALSTMGRGPTDFTLAVGQHLVWQDPKSKLW